MDLMALHQQGASEILKVPPKPFSNFLSRVAKSGHKTLAVDSGGVYLPFGGVWVYFAVDDIRVDSELC